MITLAAKGHLLSAKGHLLVAKGHLFVAKGHLFAAKGHLLAAQGDLFQRDDYYIGKTENHPHPAHPPHLNLPNRDQNVKCIEH